MLTLALTRDLKEHQGRIEEILSKDTVQMLSRSLGMRRVTDGQLWSMIIKRVGLLMSEQDLDEMDLHALASDLLRVRLNSGKLYKMLAAYSIE